MPYISALYRFDLSANKRLEQVRDLFVFGCFTGLRFSDYSNVSPENIVPIDRDYFIKLITAKTKELVIVPTNPIIMDIFRKYERNANRLPKSLSNQKFNEYIKEACREAGFTEKGRLATAPELELWQCISSHTARRSFATNLYLEGFPVIDLMKITGHKTEKAFLKYIRISKLDTAKRLNEHIKKNWSSKILKAAS
jgi:integrase